ncbi:MAG: four helix bundle protein [Proteobacteria bacterium]|nr:four helix bundle protein [Pseudomonadota bacterium]
MADQRIESYRDLRVWQEAMVLAEQVYRVTASFPKEEMYGLVSQIRRSAVSIPANIAEGHGRETSAVFIQFLRVAQGSLKELETHLILAARVGFLPATTENETLDRCDSLGRMIRSLIRALLTRSKGEK